MFVTRKSYDQLLANHRKMKEDLEERIKELLSDDRILAKNTEIQDLQGDIRILEVRLENKQQEVDRLSKIGEELRKKYQDDLERMKDINEKEVRATVEAMQNKELSELRSEVAKLRTENELNVSKVAHYKGLYDSGKVGMDYSDLKGMLLAANPSGGAAFQQLMSPNKN